MAKPTAPEQPIHDHPGKGPPVGGQPPGPKPEVEHPIAQGADRGSDSGEDEAPPDPGMETVVHEQRKRAAEMERVGVQKWVDEHAGPKDDKPRQVQGVSPTEKR